MAERQPENSRSSELAAVAAADTAFVAVAGIAAVGRSPAEDTAVHMGSPAPVAAGTGLAAAVDTVAAVVRPEAAAADTVAAVVRPEASVADTAAAENIPSEDIAVRTDSAGPVTADTGLAGPAVAGTEPAEAAVADTVAVVVQPAAAVRSVLRPVAAAAAQALL